MANANSKLVDPVIVVPGITGTGLHDEYPVDHEKVWSVILRKFDRVALHPDNLKYEAIEPARIKPDQIFGVAYNSLIEELRHNLSEKTDREVPVYPFGYDWRMPLEIIENELDAFIIEVIERTKLLRHYHNEGYENNPKVNLIGHSMGGLIISGYLANKKQEAPVNKVVTLATPFRGSFEAVMKITTGLADMGFQDKGSREREIARLTPALYYLLPAFKNGISVEEGIPDSLFDAGAWQPSVTKTIEEFIRMKGLPSDNVPEKAAVIFKELLYEAEEHNKKISSLALEQAGIDKSRWMAIVGVNYKTRVKLNVVKKNGQVEFKITPDDRENRWDDADPLAARMTGDGTVPFEGAVPPFLKENNLICVTPQDYSYWEAGDRALSAIAGFHGILPNMNLIHRLIVRFLKNLDDERGTTWGHKAPGVVVWEPPIAIEEAKK